MTENDTEDCASCLGNGIGWNGPDSHCRECSGRGYHTPHLARMEDRWAFNHFELEPGELENSL